MRRTADLDIDVGEGAELSPELALTATYLTMEQYSLVCRNTGKAA